MIFPLEGCARTGEGLLSRVIQSCNSLSSRANSIVSCVSAICSLASSRINSAWTTMREIALGSFLGGFFIWAFSQQPELQYKLGRALEDNTVTV